MTDPLVRPSRVAPQTEARLLDAARAELHDVGHAAVTVRGVARRAGTSPATAYKVFASREHLIAGVFLRTVQDLPEIDDDDPRDVSERLRDFIQHAADRIGSERELHGPVRSVVLGDDPDARRIRDLVFGEFHDRLDRVCRNELSPSVRAHLELVLAGAFALAGAGQISFGEIGSRAVDAIEAMGGRAGSDDPAGPPCRQG